MGKLADYTIDQVAGALALTLGSIGGLCLILFKSRCEKITICWGIWSCNRKVADDDDGEKQGSEAKDSEAKKEEGGETVVLIPPPAPLPLPPPPHQPIPD
tara:strand:- start:187 stop:486 length:300 start_codon:yes stop_codon:yes gene_type:complete